MSDRLFNFPLIARSTTTANSRVFKPLKSNVKYCTLLFLALYSCSLPAVDLEKQFSSPPDSAKPWVYWYFMDGNIDSKGMKEDLASMKKAGIGGAILLEVNIGVPRGTVDFMSPQWVDAITEAIHEADRLNIQIALGTGPGWCGTGGPWIKPELSMQHLVGNVTNVVGPANFSANLPQPPPRKPFFGESTFTPELKKEWQDFYRAG
jgi:alpha-L-rhamnosidase